MALVLADRVKETTTTTGTGTYTLAGAVTGFESFATIGNTNTTYYCCTDGTDFEVGVGTYASSGTTLARTTILQSSNSDNAVNWSAGTRSIFCTQPAEKAVFLNADGHIEGDVTIVSADAGASHDPTLLLYRNSASPADSDLVGDILFTGNNSADESTIYAQIESKITDVTDGTEDGYLEFNVIRAGSLESYVQLAFNNIYAMKQITMFSSLYFHNNSGNTIIFEGATEDDHETTLTVADPTADRTITLPDATGTVVLKDSSDTVTITSTDDGANPFPNLVLFRNSASPADNDDLGKIFFRGRNDNSQDVDYHSILSEIADASDGTEDARLYFKGMSGGSDVTYIQLKFGRVYLNRAVRFEDDLEITGGKGVEFQSSSDSTIETRVVADPSADRTITLPDATGTVALTSDLGTIASQAADSVNIDGGAIDAVTLGTNSAVSELQVDNINIDGNSITSTDTNGSLAFQPNGTGDILLNADTVRIGDSNANAAITTNGTGDLTLNTNSGTNSGSIVIADGSNGNISITPDGTGVLDVISTDDGSSIGPKLHLYRNSASPADFDDIGSLYFSGNDSGGNKQEYALIRGDIYDTTNGTEDAAIRFFVNVGGSSLEHMQQSFGATQITGRLYLSSNAIHSNPHIQFEGSTADDHETTFNATDPTADRTITLPDATGTVLTTGNSDTPTTTTSSSDADFVLVDDGGTMKKSPPPNLGITAGAASTDDATALAIALG